MHKAMKPSISIGSPYGCNDYSNDISDRLSKELGSAPTGYILDIYIYTSYVILLIITKYKHKMQNSCGLLQKAVTKKLKKVEYGK